MTVEEATEVLADDVLCETATDLREQLRRSILRELRLREDQQKSWRRITDLECDLADARIALEERNATINDLRKGWAS
jgi:hypothetical protein